MSAERIFRGAYDVRDNSWSSISDRFSPAKISRPIPGHHYQFDGIPLCVFGGPSVNCRWPNVTSDTPTGRPAGLPAKLWPFLPRAVNSHANHSYVVLPARAQHNSPRAELLDATAAAAAPATAAGTRSMREEAVNQAQATSKISWSRKGRLSYRSSTHRRKLSTLYSIRISLGDPRVKNALINLCN